MSPETQLLEKFEERVPRTSRKSVEAGPEEAVNLQEDITLSPTRPRVGSRPWEAVRETNALVEDEGSEEAGAATQIVFDEKPATGGRRTALRASLETLSELRSNAATVDWIEAATVLKRDVVRLRDTNYSRHAAVLLALADALTFTEPAEVFAPEDGTLFSHVLGLLSEPYISEPDEEEFLTELLTAGWNLAPSEEQA